MANNDNGLTPEEKGALIGALISLPLLARRSGFRRPQATLPPIEVTKAIQDDLLSIYRDGVKPWQAGVRDQIIPAYNPNLIDDANGRARVQAIIASISDDVGGQVLFYQTQKLGRWVRRVDAWNGEKTISGARSVTGVDIAPYVRLIDVQGELAQAITDNVAVFRAHNAATRARIEAVIADAIINRRNKKYLIAELAKALGVSKRKAAFAAEDQTHKLNASLTVIRNKQLGIPGYIWQTRQDSRVRHLHAQRQGKYFEWSKPPSDGPPGWPIRCRCVALSQLYPPDES